MVTEEPTPNDALATGRICHICFSPDGKMLITCFWDGTIQIRDTDKYALLPEYETLHHSDGIPVAKMSFDNNVVYCLTGQGALVAWEGKSSGFVQLHSSSVSDIDVHILPSGERIIAACADGFIRVWSREASKLETQPSYVRDVDTEVRSIAVANDGRVAFSGPAREVGILDIELDLRPVANIFELSGDSYSEPILAFSSDNRFLAVASGEHGLSIRSMETKSHIMVPLEDLIDPTLYRPDDLQLISLAWIRSRHTLIIGFSHGTLSLFDVETRHIIASALCGVN